ncbi:NUDIX hydrolase [Bacillus ndiopicus]|uniref:NUDIX hydrolase n=1 Tax=Bacillus ndiopicus TaxID=1347368 RepID=UPI0005A6C5B6|nr:NUDIX domain-containing protein [Bacillus ndiopicus]
MDLTVKTTTGTLNIRVAAWIENNGKILCTTYSNGITTLPGRRVKLHETTEEAIIREIAEEMSVSFKNVETLAIIENFFTLNNQSLHEFIYVFKGTIDYSEIINTSEAEEQFHWIDLEDLNQLKPSIIQQLPQLIKQFSLPIHLVNKDNQ